MACDGTEDAISEGVSKLINKLIDNFNQFQDGFMDSRVKLKDASRMTRI